MKNRIIFISLIAAILMFSCENDDSYEAPNSFSDVGWIISDVEGVLDANVGDYITFTDASQGYESHEWEITGDNFYLDHPLGRDDRGDSILSSKIIGTGKTTDKTVSVFFRESGLIPVRLYNVFPDSVGYRGSDDYRAAAKFIDNKWVIDTTFIVDVYAKILPIVKIDHANGTNTFETPELTDTDGSNVTVIWPDISVVSNNVITVEAGSSVDFTDITEVGRPETITWKIINAEDVNGNTLRYDNEGSTIGSGTELSHTFPSLGDYYIGVRVARTSQNIPNAFTTVVLPYRFNVVPSSQPFVISGDVVELEDETISIPFTGEFNSFSNQESFFTVNVNGDPFDIASVSANGTAIEIKLTDPIFRPDVITVSYDGNGDLSSTDFRIPEAFTDVPVVMHNVNLLPENIASIEDGGSFLGGAVNDSWYIHSGNNGTIEGSTEQAASGSYSIKTSLTPGGSGNGQAFIQCTISEPLMLDSDAEYTLTYKRYVEPGSSLSAVFGVFFLNDWGQKGWSNFSEPQGQWNEISFDFKLTTNPIVSGIFIRAIFDNSGNDSDATVYYDDFHLVKKEVRI